MSYNCSQASESPDVSAGFIDFLVNGELDEMLSNTPRRVYYSNLLSPEEKVDETRNDVKREMEYNPRQTSDKSNDIDLWADHDSDELCLEALDRYIWGEGYADDERLLVETCNKIEAST